MPRRCEYPLLTGRTRRVLCVVTGKNGKVCRQLGQSLWSNNKHEKRVSQHANQ